MGILVRKLVGYGFGAHKGGVRENWHVREYVKHLVKYGMFVSPNTHPLDIHSIYPGRRTRYAGFGHERQG